MSDRRRSMLGARVRASVRFGGDLFAHAVLNRAWWVIPAGLLLVAAAAVGSATKLVVPSALYVLF